MRPRQRLSWALIGAVVLLCGTFPAQSGVHLWRIEEIFSNADGTIQFIEMTTCCGSAGGETHLANQVLRSNSKTFTFPADLTMATLNKHVLLGTTGYSALPGAPSVDYTIVDNFFSLTEPPVHGRELVLEQLVLPEAEGAVTLERGHAAQHPLVHERRMAPFERFLDVRTGGVHDLAEMAEYRLREIGRTCDVGVEASVLLPHAGLLQGRVPSESTSPRKRSQARRASASVERMFPTAKRMT
jgi:hypothetical protein